MRKFVGLVKEYSVLVISFISFIVFMGEIFNWMLYV